MRKKKKQDGGPVNQDPEYITRNSAGEKVLIPGKLPDSKKYEEDRLWTMNWVNQRAGKFDKFAEQQYKDDNFMSLFGTSKEDIKNTKDRMYDNTIKRLNTVKYKESSLIPRDALVDAAEGVYTPGNHSIYFPISKPDKGTIAHETNHASGIENYSSVRKYINYLKKTDSKYKANPDSYYHSPDEIYSRIADLRRSYNLKPSDIVTPELLREKSANPWTEKANIFDHLDEETIIKLLNDLVTKDKTNPTVAKHGGTISEQGYRDDSPFKNRKSINIKTPSGLIDMSQTGIPILANGQVLEPYSGLHQMGTQTVKEIPMKKKGGKVKFQTGGFMSAPGVNAPEKKSKQVLQKTKTELNPYHAGEDPSHKLYNKNNKNKNYTVKDDNLRQIAATSIGMNYDPKLAMAIALQETGIGEHDPNNMFHLLTQGIAGKNHNSQDNNEYGINALKYKAELANRLGYNTPEMELQAFNGLGKLKRKNDLGRFNKGSNTAYGIKIPEEGIDMKKNPLYGKTVLKLKKDVIDDDPFVNETIDYYKKFYENPNSVYKTRATNMDNVTVHSDYIVPSERKGNKQSFSKTLSSLFKKGGKIPKYQTGKVGTYDEYIQSMWGNGGVDKEAPVNPDAMPREANANYVANQDPTAQAPVQTISTTGMKAPTSGQKSGNKGYAGPSFNVGAGLLAAEGIINSLIGTDDDRKKPIDPLSYNPYPQGTGSQAIFQDGGMPSPRKVSQVPEGYQPYTMKDGIPGASYFMKETKAAQKAMTTSNRTRSSVPNRNPGVRRAMPLKRTSTASGNAASLQDFIYTEPNPAPVPVAQDKPQKAWIGDNVYTGNRLSHTSQLQFRDSKNIRDNGIVDSREQIDVVHPYYPNTSNVNFDETYEVPHPVWTNYFTHGYNQIQGSLDSLKTYKVPNKLKNGGKMKKCANGGLTTFNGGSAPQVSENPFDGGTGEFQGNSHENGGIESAFNGSPFEAEGGEPYRMDQSGNLEIFGDLRNPITGNKFKKDAKIIAKKEKKVGKFTDKGLDLVLEAQPSASKWDLLKFNSGKAMLKGGLAKQKELAENKEHLSLVQRAMLEMEGPQQHYRNGGLVFQDGGKPWEYRKTKKDKIDKKILDFVEMASKKGLTGYSNEQGGYDKRNTKSGHPSRHGSNQALDAIFDDKDAYNKIMADPELSGYLYDNGLTIIDEYDPAIAAQTQVGKQVGHLHIGYDKGTPISDRFRKEYKAKYKPSTPPPAVASSRVTPYEGTNVNVGDAYTENPLTGKEYTFNRKVGDKAPRTEPAPYASPRQFEFHNPTNNVEPIKNGLPWEQIVPAIPQVFEQPDSVDSQTYQPELYTPYQVSFQDRINQNSRTFNALAPTLGRNPEAQSTLAGEQYAANNAVQAEEFRVNQAISNDITNKNVSLLNEAKLRNIQLRDTQNVRQAQAVANTRDRRTQAGIQIGDVLAKNSLENKTAAVYKNLYRDYKFDKDMTLQYVGPNAEEHIDANNMGNSYPVSSTVTKKVGDTTTKDVYEPYNYKPISLMDGYEKRARGRMTLGAIAKKLYQ